MDTDAPFASRLNRVEDTPEPFRGTLIERLKEDVDPRAAPGKVRLFRDVLSPGTAGRFRVPPARAVRHFGSRTVCKPRPASVSDPFSLG